MKRLNMFVDNRQGKRERIDLSKFNKDQVFQINKGFESGVDVNIYAKSYFDYSQMEVLRQG